MWGKIFDTAAKGGIMAKMIAQEAVKDPRVLLGVGSMGWQGAGNMLGRTGRAAATGALMGAGWGAVSSDTSVIGGAMIGAGLGVGARYGRIGYQGGKTAIGMTSGVPFSGRARLGLEGAGRQMWASAQSDWAGARLAANNMGARIKGLWGGK